jgi:protein gp37
VVVERIRRTLFGIEWTDITWNPLVGCAWCGAGCDLCYAEMMSVRQAGMAAKGAGNTDCRFYLPVISNLPAEIVNRRPGKKPKAGFNGKVNLIERRLPIPFTWNKPRVVFVNSMSDLFHKDVPDAFVHRVCRVMAMTPWHTYQVLTKRSPRMCDWLNGPGACYAGLPNVWWGVSVENRAHGLPRLRHLQQASARNRFLSVEPLLEDLGAVDLAAVRWVIVGGESGPAARPMREGWVLAVKEQCERAGGLFFFKQWGGRNKKAAGRTLLGRTWDDMPAPSPLATPPRARRLALREEFHRWEATLLSAPP